MTLPEDFLRGFRNWRGIRDFKQPERRRPAPAIVRRRLTSAAGHSHFTRRQKFQPSEARIATITPASTVTTTIAANATPTFGIFVTGNATDVVWCAHGATHRQEEAFLEGRTTLPARQCSGELAHRLLMLLVPDFDKITGDLELHTLVQRDLPRTFFPDTFVKIGDRRVQCAGDLK
jgi:hypothetical protein